MALDGIFLNCVKREIEQTVTGARVDKIYQPNGDEFIFNLRTRAGSYKLLVCIRSNSPRIHFTKFSVENPEHAPMLCMLFRKKLVGAKLIAVRQMGLERALYLDFDATNEVGDRRVLTLAVEIMGKCSNVILVDQNGIIIDALRRVSLDMSSKRQVLPGLKYQEPPPQKKARVSSISVSNIVSEILNGTTGRLSDAILARVEGVSPAVCKEIEHRVLGTVGSVNHTFLRQESEKLTDELLNIADIDKNGSDTGYMVVDEQKNPIDFSFLEFSGLKPGTRSVEYSSFCELLDEFYYERDTHARMKSKSQSLVKSLKNIRTRVEKKIKTQESELLSSKNSENLRIYGDIITANLYRMEKGVSEIQLENFYEPSCKKVVIPLDPRFDGSQNAQKYYKKYKKAKTAQKVLGVQIEKSREELEYIDGVLYEVTMAENEAELNEIKEELIAGGYIKQKSADKKKVKTSGPNKFLSSDGFIILVGKNNVQNDTLTLKTAHKNDLWFHIKDGTGSHTVIVTDGKEVSERAILEAATIAAYHSSARDSANVAVDYTRVKNVKKTPGAKPGMVVYSGHKTIFVTPSYEFIEPLYCKK